MKSFMLKNGAPWTGRAGEGLHTVGPGHANTKVGKGNRALQVGPLKNARKCFPARMTIRLHLLAIAGLLTTLTQAAPPPATPMPVPPVDLPAAVQQQLAVAESIQAKAEEGGKALRAWYSTALDAVKKDAVARGDLDGVVAADAERDRAERDLTEAEKNALPKLCREVRDKFDEARARHANQVRAATLASLQSYAITLEGLEKRLTQEGKLEDAIAVRLERVKLAKQLAGGEPVPAPPAPATPVPARSVAPAPNAPAPATLAAITRENPAKIACEEMDPGEVVEGGDTQKLIEAWVSFPAEFKGATIYYPKSVKADQSKAAVVYKTLAPGRVYVVINFKDQGNSGGGWKNDRWVEADFLAHGWSRVAGAEFVNQKGGSYMVLTKVLTMEDGGRLRSNKYNPPYLMTFAPRGT